LSGSNPLARIRALLDANAAAATTGSQAAVQQHTVQDDAAVTAGASSANLVNSSEKSRPRSRTDGSGSVSTTTMGSSRPHSRSSQQYGGIGELEPTSLLSCYRVH
jgi:hypothetical protein